MKKVFQSADKWLSPFFHSIRFRLTLWFVFTLALVLGVFSVFIYFVQARDLQGDSVARMQEKFTRIQDYFRGAEWQVSDLSPGNVPGTNVPLQKGDLLILVDTKGSTLQSWGENLSEPNSIIKELVSAGSQHRALNKIGRAHV